MKKLITSLFVFVAITFTVNAQWSLQTNPIGLGDAMLGKIQFVSATEGWIACGSNGSLLHTTDAGETWNIVTPFPAELTVNFSDPALSMSWANPTHGWALKTFSDGMDEISNHVNGAILYSTIDGGNSWSKKSFPKTIETTTFSSADIQGSWQFHAVTAKNPLISNSISGWMQGTVTVNSSTCSLSALRSNGTTKTQELTIAISSTGIISMDGQERGFMSADKTTAILTGIEDNDGYSMYVLQKQVAGTTYSIADLQGSWQMHVLSVGNENSQFSGWGRAAMTCDANGNFSGTFVDVGEGSGGTLDFTAAISSNGIISGMTSISNDTHGFMTADKKSFYTTMTTENGDFNLVVFQKQVPGTNYTAADLRGNWQMQILTADEANDFQALADYKHGTLNLEDDGNGNYSYFLANSTTPMSKDYSMAIGSDGTFSVNGTPTSHGFLSADKSLGIMTATDGSGGYSLFVMQKDIRFSGDIGLQVQFVDNNNGWVTNYNMNDGGFQLYKTTDGGATWNPISTTVGGLYQFKDANNGWMIGNSSNNLGGESLNNIYHTTDGGATWTEQATNIGKANALYFPDLLNGWVVGENGLILKTIDGGTNWTPVTNAGNTAQTKSKTVFFLNSNNGWIGSGLENTEGAGSRFILATNDGGATWTTQSIPVTNSIFSISFWDENHGWATSDYGQIAHFHNTTSANNLYSSQLSIYPNPTTDGFFSDAGDRSAIVSIYNMNGIQMLSRQVNGKTYIDISNLHQGLFIVKITTSEGTFEKKLVKE